MSTNIKINIVEPGTPPSPTPTPTPIDPSTTGTTDISVPDTGLFTHGIGSPEATIIGVAMLLAVVAAVVILYKKHKTQGKATKLVRMVDHIKTIFKSKKRITASLVALALLASAGTLAVLLASSGKSNTNAIEGGTELTVDVDSEDLTIEVGDTPVFAVLPVELTVEEATTSGYILSAFTEDTDLVSTTDDTNIIPMVSTDEGELVALAEDTYGLSLAEPDSQTDKTYTSLSTDQSNPTILKSIDGYSETEENDTTTIYYGFYITPDTPKGTYEGGEIYYKATANEVATVVFDGNGLYFNGNEVQTTNTANYIIGISDNAEKNSHTPNVNNSGVKEANLNYGTAVNNIVTIPGAAKLNIELTYGGGLWYGNQYGYLSFWIGSHPDYRANTNYETGIQSCGSSAVTDGRFGTDSTETTVECEITGDTVTFDYWTSGGGPGGKEWYGYYAAVTGYDADGNIIYLPGNKMVSGDYLAPSSDSYYRFLGWSKEQDATTPTYATEKDIVKELDLTLGETTTLYAVWQVAYTISYNGNGADTATNMDNVEQYTTNVETTSQVDLLASNFTKDGYGFVGWSTDQNAWEHLTDDDESNNPTIYGPNQMITVDPSTSTKLNLYAVWAPAETDGSGNPVLLQDWQGCSNLTATTYDSNTGTLNVGKNTITALTDSRDGSIYTVARLADGSCWMTENLRLDNEPELSQQNTNNPSLPLTNNYAEQTSSNKLSPSSNDWCEDYAALTCYDRSMLNANNTTFTATSPAFSQDFTSQAHKDFDTSIYSYSNYYNWYSATAGNGKQETTSTVAGDICPAGWQLPVGGSNNTSGSFYYLHQQMGAASGTTGSNNWRSFPNNFVYSGIRYGSSADNRGYYGYYWSSTAKNTNRAYYLYLYSGNVVPGTSDVNENRGYSVRCVVPIQTTITFDGNGNDGGEMPRQRIAANTTAPLYGNVFTKNGYKFVGWNVERDNSGTSYVNGQEFTAENGAAGIILYAQWEEAPYMQDVANWGSTLNEGDSIEVADKRDGKVYWVAKLADGNIWMTQNLDLDIEAGRTYTSTDTDLAYSSIGTTWTPSVSTSTTSSWIISGTAPSSYDPGNLYWDGNVTTSGDTIGNSTTANSSATLGGTHYHIGNYYNWTAAVAMNNSSSYTTDGQDVNQSICPAGWRLPTYSGDKSYQNLVSAQNLTSGVSGNIQNAPTYFIYGGYWTNYSGYVGEAGSFWSSVVWDATYAHRLEFGANRDPWPQSSIPRYEGYPLRCVVR